jgi:GT2 family glycosyltransferase
MVKACIVIPVHNRKAFTQNILAQIYGQLNRLQAERSTDELFTIVVDDGSTDGTQELIQQNFPKAVVLKGDGSLWWTGAIVKGMKYAMEHLQTDYVVWLNDDISLSENFVADLLALCRSAMYETTVVGGIVRDQTYPHWVVYSGISQGQPIREMSCYANLPELEAYTLSGNIVVIPRAVIEKAGYPNVQKFPHHGGDFEYIRWVRRKGFKVISSSKLQAFTDYQPSDLIRYMPYWMQWYLKRDRPSRNAILKGLKSIKSNQNIWLFVNIQNRDRDRIPAWKYQLCYLDKCLKLLLIDFIPKKYIEPKILDYFKSWQVPFEIDNLLPNQGKPSGTKSTAPNQAV